MLAVFFELVGLTIYNYCHLAYGLETKIFVVRVIAKRTQSQSIFISKTNQNLRAVGGGGGGGGGGVAFYDDRLCNKIFTSFIFRTIIQASCRKLYPGARMHRRANHYLQYRRFVYLVLVAVRILPVFHPLFHGVD